MTLSDRRLQRAYAPRPADYIEPDPTFRFSVIGAALHRAGFARAFNAAAAVTFRMPTKKRKVRRPDHHGWIQANRIDPPARGHLDHVREPNPAIPSATDRVGPAFGRRRRAAVAQ